MLLFVSFFLLKKRPKKKQKTGSWGGRGLDCFFATAIIFPHISLFDTWVCQQRLQVLALKFPRDGDVAQLAERRTGTLLTRVPFPFAARDFVPQNQLSVQTLTVSPQPSCAMACVNICAHVKEPKYCSRTFVCKQENKNSARRNGWRWSYGCCSLHR